jgi:hypothetical protein
MMTMPNTRHAATQVWHHDPDPVTRQRAAALLQTLTSCETALATDAPTAPALLGDLVIATATLTSWPWLHANADDPGVATFTALHGAEFLPSTTSLDQILATLLRTRFEDQADSRSATDSGASQNPA